MEFVLAVFGFGALLLLAGIVGGDLTFRGATLPKLGTLPRFTLTTLGGGLIATSAVLWAAVLPLDGDTTDGVTTAPATAAPGTTGAPAADGAVATVTRDLSPSHRQETLELFVDQRRVGELRLDAETPSASLKIPRPDEPVGYEAVMQARTHADDPLTQHGTGTLEPASAYRVLLNPASATVRLVPE